MKSLIILFLIIFSIKDIHAQDEGRVIIEDHDSTIFRIKSMKKNLHIVLIDTCKLRKDLISYLPLRRFIKPYLDSINPSFVSSISVDFNDGKFNIRNKNITGNFDSICAGFCKDYILNYRWKIKERTFRKDYIVIVFDFLVDNETKNIVFDIFGRRNKSFAKVYRLQIPESLLDFSFKFRKRTCPTIP